MINKSPNNELQTNCLQCSLKDFSVFKDCSTEILNEIFSHKTVLNFKKGEYLVNKNDKFKGVFCIQQGLVKISTSGTRNREFILWFARPGDIIGLDSFINNEDYSFSAMAVDNVYTCFIPATDFKSILTKGPGVSIGLMKDLCDKINFIEDRITSIARKKIREQFAEVLISLAMKNKNISSGDVQIDYPIKDLANIVGTTKNYLYKILSDLSEQKVIYLHNRKLIIKNFDKLSHIAVGDESLC